MHVEPHTRISEKIQAYVSFSKYGNGKLSLSDSHKLVLYRINKFYSEMRIQISNSDLHQLST